MLKVIPTIAIAAMFANGLLAGSAIAQQPVTQQAQKPNPNERVCENITLVGSRLAVKRLCGTRAEWEERRRLDREVVEQAQRSANDPCNTINTRTGPPAC